MYFRCFHFIHTGWVSIYIYVKNGVKVNNKRKTLIILFRILVVSIFFHTFAANKDERRKNHKMRKAYLFAALSMALLTGCQESMEQRTLREVQEYTAKHCPERTNDFTILDSLTFDVATHTLTENLTLTNGADSPEKIGERLEEIRLTMIEAVRNNTQYKRMKEEGYSFRFVARSQQYKDSVIYEQIVTKEDYR